MPSPEEMTARKHLNRRQLIQRLKPIRLLVLDVDGVLTDDHIYFGPDGFELKIFLKNDEDGEDFVKFIEDIIEEGKKTGEPLFEAIEGINIGKLQPKRGGSTKTAVTIFFQETGEPELVEIEKGHFVACH